MADMMTFPDTVEEFMEQYKVVDTDGVYMSKGSELVPIFRMRQWFEHLPSAQLESCDDPRADVYYLAEKIGIHQLYALVVELRGEPEPCEDAISIDWITEYMNNMIAGSDRWWGVKWMLEDWTKSRENKNHDT